MDGEEGSRVSSYYFFFSFPDASLWESSMPIFTTLRQMLHGCYLKDHSNLPYEVQHEC